MILPYLLPPVGRSAFDRRKRHYIAVFAWIALAAYAPWASADNPRGFGFLPVKAAEYKSFPKAKRYRAYLPPAVDLSRFFPTPGDQGLMNSCMGWAVGYAARAYYAMKLEGRNTAKPENVPSPSYIYHAIRPSQNCKAGTQFDHALDLLKKGSLSLASFPYQMSCRIPGAAERASATDFRISGWEAISLPALDDVKGAGCSRQAGDVRHGCRGPVHQHLRKSVFTVVSTAPRSPTP